MYIYYIYKYYIIKVKKYISMGLFIWLLFNYCYGLLFLNNINEIMKFINNMICIYVVIINNLKIY